jgi:hypothetical protein
MNNHQVLIDSEFEHQFANRTLDPALFTHEAHLRLAWIHITKYGVEKAIKNICVQLVNYTEFLGARDKYNHTVTIAAIRAVYHFMLKSHATTFAEFILLNQKLKYNFKELLSFHYRTDVFKSELAKREYLTPELAPFD